MKQLGWIFGAILGLSACQAKELSSQNSVSLDPLGDLPEVLGKDEPGKSTPLEFQVKQASPRVKGDRLWTYLESLVGQRYGEAERAATRQRITEALVASGWQVEEQRFDQGINLVATYPLESAGDGEEAQQILVGAHYDTVQGSPGADDNATGVAALLEIAALYDEQIQSRRLAQSEIRLDRGQRGLRLVFFDQEERGLLGSLAFTAEDRNLETIHSAVVLDMLGASCGEPGCQTYPEFLDKIVEGQSLNNLGDFIAVVGEMERPGLLGAFGTRATAEDGTQVVSKDALPDVLRVPVPLKGLLTPDVLRSDHAPFWLNGVGAVLVTDTANLRNPHYHQPSDGLDQVDRVFFEGVTQQVVDGVWRLRWENLP